MDAIAKASLSQTERDRGRRGRRGWIEGARAGQKRTSRFYVDILYIYIYIYITKRRVRLNGALECVRRRGVCALSGRVQHADSDGPTRMGLAVPEDMARAAAAAAAAAARSSPWTRARARTYVSLSLSLSIYLFLNSYYIYIYEMTELFSMTIAQKAI